MGLPKRFDDLLRATMKSIIFAILYSLTISQNSHAQDFQWESTNGPDGGIVYSMATESMGRAFVGGLSGIYRSDSNIDNWEFIGLDSIRIFSIHIALNGYIYAGTYEQIVYRSLNGGTNWDMANSGIENKTVQSFIDGVGNSIFAGTHRGIFRTNDNGDNWLLSGLPDLIIDYFGKNSLNYLFAGTNEGIYRSVDSGTTWELQGPDSIDVRGIALNDAGDIFIATTDGIFSTVDGGITWGYISIGDSNSYANAIFVDSAENIFASTQNGVFRSSDNGVSWEIINVGLINFYVNTFSLNSQNILIAGTAGGVFRSSDSGDTWVELILLREESG